MNKIIFLDIDGVLNYFRMPWNDKIYHEDRSSISAKCLSCLNDLTDKTGAKIVITSTWRKIENPDMDDIATKMKFLGVTGDIIGVTPDLGKNNYRGNEIEAWIRQNSGMVNNYVILDDDSDMLYWHRNNFVHTDHYVGLTPSMAHRAMIILSLGNEHITSLKFINSERPTMTKLFMKDVGLSLLEHAYSQKGQSHPKIEISEFHPYNQAYDIAEKWDIMNYFNEVNKKYE